TPEDIKFLRTFQAGRRENQPKVSAKEFRNIAIICGRHTQKDEINTLGCQRFADETGQKLTHFYSIDKWGKEKDPASKSKWGKSKSAPKSKHKSNEIPFDEQLEIWKLRHGATDNFAGKLSLCLGMPVMIRNNDATELCITKGQEGFVVGWQAERGPHGKQVLDTLFVKLHKPAKTIKIPGLPKNIVPLVKSSRTIECILPSDNKESIERSQVNVLPNFAMTDYASQGKTRPYNVVHLNSCHSHMSYYTCLSRSSTAAGTIIIQGFDPRIITMGCSGYLRQEFREHELLDEITRLRYEDELPDHIQGITRNILIRAFQNWKGVDFVPEKVDQPLRWSAKDPFDILPVVTDSPWQIIIKSKEKNASNSVIPTAYIPAKGSNPLKHKLDDCDDKPNNIKKVEIFLSTSNSNALLGLKWNSKNYSCAYDSLFGILYNIWRSSPDEWSEIFEDINDEYMGKLANGFKDVFQRNSTLENVRDNIREILHTHDPEKFPMGKNNASVAELAFEIMKSDFNNALSQIFCANCDFIHAEYSDQLGFIFDLSSRKATSTQKWISTLDQPCVEKCPECSEIFTHQIDYTEAPKILVLEYPLTNIKSSHQIKIKVGNEVTCLQLKGIVYHGQNHFTSRFIDSDRTIWYNDGIETGKNFIEDGHLSTIADKDLRNCKDQNLVLAVYA
ncbi:hypothetical protein GALMADRAFT_82610, partial [Galerina marginata CBS 339.88]